MRGISATIRRIVLPPRNPVVSLSYREFDGGDHMPDGTQNRQTNTLEPFWMPFTANRQFKAAPRMLVSAKDMHYTDDQGRQILDGTAGMWCSNAGHGRARCEGRVAACFLLPAGPQLRHGVQRYQF
mgnify:CR=1 FL=1